MSIPAGPVSEHNPVLSAKAAEVRLWESFGAPDLASLGGRAKAPVPTWFTCAYMVRQNMVRQRD